MITFLSFLTLLLLPLSVCGVGSPAHSSSSAESEDWIGLLLGDHAGTSDEFSDGGDTIDVSSDEHDDDQSITSSLAEGFIASDNDSVGSDGYDVHVCPHCGGILPSADENEEEEEEDEDEEDEESGEDGPPPAKRRRVVVDDDED